LLSQFSEDRIFILLIQIGILIIFLSRKINLGSFYIIYPPLKILRSSFRTVYLKNKFEMWLHLILNPGGNTNLKSWELMLPMILIVKIYSGHNHPMISLETI